MMRTGDVEANLVHLNEHFQLPWIPELMHRKVTGTEKGILEAADLEFHAREYARLTAELEQAMETSTLPEHGAGGEQLNDLLIRIRLKTAA